MDQKFPLDRSQDAEHSVNVPSLGSTDMRDLERNRWPAIVFTVMIAVIISLGWFLAARVASEVSAPPPGLRETGLYSDFGSRTINPRNLSYSPQYPLWSDGA
jgi:hypothetical protein